MFLPGLWKLVERISQRADRRGRSDRAEAIVTWYARRRPKDPDSWVLWGEFLMNHGRYAEAETVFREAVRVHPEDAELPGWLAHALYEGGKLDEAEAKYREALRARPADAATKAWLAQVLYRERKLQESCQLWTELSHLQPDRPEPHEGLAWIALATGDWEEARTQVRAALQKGPSGQGRVRLLLNMATALVGAPGELPWAEELAREALKIAPDLPPAHELLGVMLEARDDPAATWHLERGMSLDKSPDPAAVVEWLRGRLHKNAEHISDGETGPSAQGAGPHL